jgi:hypothetical protein
MNANGVLKACAALLQRRKARYIKQIAGWVPEPGRKSKRKVSCFFWKSNQDGWMDGWIEWWMDGWTGVWVGG